MKLERFEDIEAWQLGPDEHVLPFVDSSTTSKISGEQSSQP